MYSVFTSWDVWINMGATAQSKFIEPYKTFTLSPNKRLGQLVDNP